MNIKGSWLCRIPIAHRGLHTTEIPENSLNAFENAILHDYPIELDLRITDDDKLVVFHDESLKRMTDTNGYITNVKSADLKNYKFLGTNQTIPALEEALELISGKVPVLIEIKNACKVGSFEKKLLGVLNQYKGEFAVQSFNPYSLEFFKHKAPGILRGQIAAVFTKEEEHSWLRRFFLSRLKLNKFSKPDFISYRANNLPNPFVTKSGLPVLAWTITSNGELEHVRDLCDNIIFEKFVPQYTAEK
jgi:glycerophosphoryl diester phosphodiesterase